MPGFILGLTKVYDHLEEWWESRATMRLVALITLVIYFLGLASIEAKRVGLIPEPVASLVPNQHIWAIHLAFTTILIVELISLIFSISSSFSRSVGKQFEILALILLRNAFKELAHLEEPIVVAKHWEPIVNIGAYALGALFIFIALRVFLNISPHGHYIREPAMRLRYAISKKLLALFLLCIYVGLGVRDVWIFTNTGVEQNFFGTVYTVLIFADIALVLIAQRYMPCFHAVFRNSGYVIATLLMLCRRLRAGPCVGHEQFRKTPGPRPLPEWLRGEESPEAQGLHRCPGKACQKSEPQAPCAQKTVAFPHILDPRLSPGIFSSPTGDTPPPRDAENSVM